MTTQISNKTADAVVRGDALSFRQEIVAGKHHLLADEPVSADGGDTAPIRTIICWQRWASAHR